MKETMDSGLVKSLLNERRKSVVRHTIGGVCAVLSFAHLSENSHSDIGYVYAALSAYLHANAYLHPLQTLRKYRVLTDVVDNLEDMSAKLGIISDRVAQIKH